MGQQRKVEKREKMVTLLVLGIAVLIVASVVGAMLFIDDTPQLGLESFETEEVGWLTLDEGPAFNEQTGQVELIVLLPSGMGHLATYARENGYAPMLRRNEETGKAEAVFIVRRWRDGTASYFVKLEPLPRTFMP